MTSAQAGLNQFHNKNGQDFEILRIENFNDIDKEYYKNSWQKHYVALLRNPRQDSYVVASMLGEEEWGNGYYYEDKAQALRKYNSMVADYRA